MKNAGRVFLLLLPAVAVLAGPKEKVLPKDLPAYGELKPVAAPKVTELRLENGMTVWLAPASGFPKVSFALVVRGGYSGDPKDRPGLADVIASTVTQGTTGHSARQVAEAIAAAGGDLNSDATPDGIYLTTSVLADHAEAALGILSDLAAKATFADQEVEIAKSNAASALEANEAEPGFLGRRALYRAMFGDHSYGIIGPTKDSIANTTAAELREQYERRFRPDRTLLVATGDFAIADLEKTIRSDFGAWRPANSAPLPDSPAPAYSPSRTIVYVPRANSVQTALYLGAMAVNRAQPDYAAVEVANAMYGGMFGSRLTENIREDKGYTYSPGSRLVSRSQAGILATRADVRNAVTGASFNEITYELNRMATTAPEAAEIERARRYLLGSIAIELQSRASVARALANLWVASLPPGELGALTEKIAKVSVSDVAAAGRKYFPASRMTVVAVGDEKVIKQELAPFGMEFTKAQ